MHGQAVDVGVQVFFLLKTLHIQPLAEISLIVKQANADQRHAQVGSTFDVVAGQHAQAAGINGQRFVQAELGGKVSHRTRLQHAGVRGAPGLMFVQIFFQPVVSVVDATIKHQLARPFGQVVQRNFAEQSNGVVIQLPPANRVQIAE